MGLYLRRRLPRARHRRCPGAALRQHRGDGAAPQGDQPHRRLRRPLRAGNRPCRLAHQRQAEATPQHHLNPLATLCARTEPDREHLGVPAKKQLSAARVQRLRRNRRSLLHRMERPDRYATPGASGSRSRTRGDRTRTAPIPVCISRSGECPWRTMRRRPEPSVKSEWAAIHEPFSQFRPPPALNPALDRRSNGFPLADQDDHALAPGKTRQHCRACWASRFRRHSSDTWPIHFSLLRI